MSRSREFSPCLLICAYNPTERLLQLLDEIRGNPDIARIVIVDDGSEQAYRAAFDKIPPKGVVVLRHPSNRGKGEALKTGLRHAKEKGYSHVVCADCDLQHTAVDIGKVVASLKRLPDAFHIGRRRLSFTRTPLMSYVGNTVINLLLRRFMRLGLHDSQCGLRAFATRWIDSFLGLEGRRFDYELQVLLEAQRRGLAFVEVEIGAVYEETHSTHFRPLADSLRILRSLFPWPLGLLAPLAAALALVVATGEFIGDDALRIFWNRQLFEEGYATVITDIMPDRPVLFVLLYAIFRVQGLSPLGFKICSLTLHALNGILLYRLTSALSPRHGAHSSILAPFVFLFHPLFLFAVMSAVQAGTLLSCLSTLVILHLVLGEGVGPMKGLLAVLAHVVGVLSKQTAFINPLFYLLANRYRRTPRRGYGRTFLMLVTIDLIPVYYYLALKIDNQSGFAEILDPARYLLAQAKVVCLYVRDLLIPWNQRFGYRLALPADYFWSAGPWLLALHAAILSYAVLWLRDRRARFLVLLFYVSLIPESSIFPIKDLRFDHRFYLPGALLVLMLAPLLDRLARTRPGRLASTGLVLGLACISLGQAHSSRTFLRWSAREYELSDKSAKSAIRLLNSLLAVTHYRRHFAQDPDLVERYRMEFSARAAGGGDEERIVEAYVRLLGYESLPPTKREKTLQFILDAASGVPTLHFLQFVNFVNFVVTRANELDPAPRDRLRAKAEEAVSRRFPRRQPDAKGQAPHRGSGLQ